MLKRLGRNIVNVLKVSKESVNTDIVKPSKAYLKPKVKKFVKANKPCKRTLKDMQERSREGFSLRY